MMNLSFALDYIYDSCRYSLKKHMNMINTYLKMVTFVSKLEIDLIILLFIG